MANWRNYSSTSVQDTLAVTITSGSGSLYAGSGAPIGYPAPPFILNLEPGTANQEIVLVNSGAGTSGSPWLISRGADGSAARAHNAGTVIAHTLSAGDLTQAANHYSQGAGSAVHGLPAAAWLTGAFLTFFESTTTSAQASLSWSSIPQTAQHLLITGQGRLAESSVLSDDMMIQFNGDAGAHYSYMTQFSMFSGTLTQPTAGNGFAVTSPPLFRMTASQSGSTANVGGGFAFIPNYTSASFNKMVYVMSGAGNGTTSFIDMRNRIVCWNPVAQAAITSIGLIAPAGGFNANCQFCLYAFG